MKGDAAYQYEGDRTKDDIVNFALRLVGPSVNQIESKSDFESAKKRSELFFVFTGPMNGPDWEQFQKLATKMQQHEFFYQMTPELSQSLFDDPEENSIRVYKDDTSYRFEHDLEEQRSPRDAAADSNEELQGRNISESLHHWLLRERFPRFVKVTRGRFGHLMSTQKLLVMAVLEENKLGEITPDMEAFRGMLHMVMDTHIDRYR